MEKADLVHLNQARFLKKEIKINEMNQLSQTNNHSSILYQYQQTLSCFKKSGRAGSELVFGSCVGVLIRYILFVKNTKTSNNDINVSRPLRYQPLLVAATSHPMDRNLT
jgi:hypothetical protein